jgi:hypothetical protein
MTSAGVPNRSANSDTRQPLMTSSRSSVSVVPAGNNVTMSLRDSGSRADAVLPVELDPTRSSRVMSYDANAMSVPGMMSPLTWSAASMPFRTIVVDTKKTGAI